jgi:GH24 family phage-related lysozyme (muramidase)
MAKNEPLRARELLKQHKGELEGGKALQLEDTINQQIINVQTRVDSDNIIQSGALVPKDLKEAVKKFEGYSEKPYSDYKQTSSGYGTKAQPGDENIPPEQRKAVYEARLDSELARAANIVDQFAPGLPDGTRKALISLTYNAGSAWTSAGLGQAIKPGTRPKLRTCSSSTTRLVARSIRRWLLGAGKRYLGSAARPTGPGISLLKQCLMRRKLRSKLSLTTRAIRRNTWTRSSPASGRMPLSCRRAHGRYNWITVTRFKVRTRQ